MHLKHFLILTTFLIAAPSITAQTEILHEIKGFSIDYIGSSVDGAGDIDHDGYDDLIVGSHRALGLLDPPGRIDVRSGRTGAVLWSFVGGSGERLGQDVAGGFDVDGDGTCDFAAGFNREDANGSGGVIVWSGATGAVLMSRTGNSGLGLAVDFAGDLDGDGRSEVLVGIPFRDIFLGSSDVGQFQVWKWDPNSTQPITLFSRLGSRMDGTLGRGVARAGDVDGDGVSDLAIGEPGYSFTQGPFVYTPGRVLLYSGQAAASGQTILIRHLDGTDLFNGIGHVLDAGRDVNGDGTPDIIAGSATEGCEVFSGLDGSTLHLLDNAQGMMSGVGRAVALIGDRTTDGKAEFVVSLPDGGDGEVRILEGNAGIEIGRIDGSTGSSYGGAIASGGDLDGDGRDDLIVSAPTENVISGPFAFPNAGTVRVYPFSPAIAFSEIEGHGSVIVSTPDLNGDGLRDVAVGSPNGSLFNPGVGAVYLRSGDGVTPPFNFAVGLEPGDNFGTAIVPFDDDDGDGFADLVVGAPGEDFLNVINSGRLHVRSGQFGGPLRFIDSGPLFSSGMRHGASLALFDDVDQDGRPEIVAGAPGGRIGAGPPAGIAILHSGATGAVLGVVGGMSIGDEFGATVATIPDVNGDGVSELAVGSPKANAQGGRLDVFDGASLTGAPVALFTVNGSNTMTLGSSLAHAGDVNGDGTADVIVGAPDALAGSGRARVYCGLTGTLLLEVSSLQLKDLMGASVASAGDMNGDGLDDVLIGAPGNLQGFPSTPNAASAGQAIIVSGTGEILRRFQGIESGGFLGQTVASLDDFDGDGFREIAFTRVRTAGFDQEQDVYIVKPRRLAGIEAFGEGTPGCRGVVRLLGNSPPRIGNSAFEIITDNAPPLTTGITLLAESTARVNPGQDLFGLGLTFHLDPTIAPGATAITTVTDATGFARIPAPLPNLPIIAGFQLLLQGIWFEGPCQPGFGYSMTNGLEITLQP